MNDFRLRLFTSLGPLLAALLADAGSAGAQESWRAIRLDPSSFPAGVVAEARPEAPGGLPDGLVASHDGGDIAAAWYAGPTTRYRHGVLGDAVEASVLVVRTAAGRELSLPLPATEVFEDRAPRLADLDGDGRVEVITIRSSIRLGASVAVYGLEENVLVEQASSGFIGRANRWLNIAGIAPFRGGPGQEIAYVQTPHIGGTLFILAYEAGRLLPVGSMKGFSNHRMGATELRLSAIADVNGDGRPDLALPSDDRSRLRLVGYADNALSDLAFAELPARIDKAIAVKGAGPEARFIVGLENAEVYEVHR